MKKFIIGLVLCMSMLVGCNSNVNPIKGHWISDDGNIEVYFNDDEYNTMKVINRWGETTGTYEIEGNSLKIITKSEEKICNYKVENDVLELSDPTDSDDVETYYRVGTND